MNNILLIEDDPFLLDIYKKKLELADFNLQIADTGEKALKAIKSQTFDMILLDIVLPQVDGWDILQAIAKEPKNKTTKVFILSNLGQKEEVEKGLRLGAVKYLIKAQYTPGEVVKEIKAMLK